MTHRLEDPFCPYQMEHKTILCSATFLSNSGPVSGAVLKNCSGDFSTWKLVTESPAMY